MRTCLYSRHINLGAKMIDFSGWEMPIQYTGIIQEHLAVRTHVGLFDVSHMARILVEGTDAELFLDYLSTNKIVGKKQLSATYTVWCSEDGMCVDDVIVYKIDQQHFFVIINAANRQKDLDHLLKYSKGLQVHITPLFEEGIISIQGPLAVKVVSKVFPKAESIDPMHFDVVPFQNKQVIVSATGYTGAGGFELYGDSSVIIALWDKFMEEGKDLGIQPIGLGARDTLRLEKGYALYGHELSDKISALESVSAWTIKKDKANFVGKTAIIELEKSASKRYEYGVVLKDKGIAREGYEVMNDQQTIGFVTSGTFSPSLNKAIALVLVDRPMRRGDLVEIKIRQNLAKAEVVALPFL